jgi:hypothetical protein
MGKCRGGNMNKSIVLIVTLSLSTFLASCSSMYDKQVQWQRVKPESFPVLQAIGYAPISLQRSDNETQRMLMAISASKAAAYVELAEQVYGQQVSNDLTMADLLVTNHQINAKVQGVIRGARVVKSYTTGDTYNTELSLDFKDVYDAYEVLNVDKKIEKVIYY